MSFHAGYTSTRAPGTTLVYERPLLVDSSAGASFLSVSAAWLASALPTKPGPSRQADSAIKFNSKVFFSSLLFLNVQSHGCEGKFSHRGLHIDKRGELFSVSSL